MNIVKETLSYRVGYYKGNEFITHCEDGPAYVKQTRDGHPEEEHYYHHGKFHNTLGPAIIYYTFSTPSESYYIFGKQIRPSDFYKPGFVDALILENS